MEPNEKQNKEKIISWISFVVVVLVLGGVFWYVYQEQRNTIAGFQDNLQKLQQENDTANTKLVTTNKTLNETTKTLTKTSDELAIVKFVCSSFTECKQRMGKKLQERLLKRNGIDTFTEEGGGTGLNFYKYFLDPQKWGGPDDPVSNEMLAFIKEQCPASIYNQPGFLVSKSRYRIDKTKIAEIIMDNAGSAPSEILCAWTEDETTKQFQKID